MESCWYKNGCKTKSCLYDFCSLYPSILKDNKLVPFEPQGLIKSMKVHLQLKSGF